MTTNEVFEFSKFIISVVSLVGNVAVLIYLWIDRRK